MKTLRLLAILALLVLTFGLIIPLIGQDAQPYRSEITIRVGANTNLNAQVIRANLAHFDFKGRLLFNAELWRTNASGGLSLVDRQTVPLTRLQHRQWLQLTGTNAHAYLVSNILAGLEVPFTRSANDADEE